jgi:hypothetical protein
MAESNIKRAFFAGVRCGYRAVIATLKRECDRKVDCLMAEMRAEIAATRRLRATYEDADATERDPRAGLGAS